MMIIIILSTNGFSKSQALEVKRCSWRRDVKKRYDEVAWAQASWGLWHATQSLLPSGSLKYAP